MKIFGSVEAVEPATPPAGKVVVYALADGMYAKFDDGSVVGPFGAAAGDMLKATYDVDNDGVVDNAEKLVSTTPSASGLAVLAAASYTVIRTLLELGTAALKNDGEANGVASLDASGKVPAAQLLAAVVLTTGAQALADKTFTRPVSTNGAETQQVLTDAAAIDWDVDLGGAARLTLGAAGRTMNAPTHLRAGATYVLEVIQDATGNRTITTWNTAFKWPSGTAPTLSTAAGAKDLFSFYSPDGSTLWGNALKGFA